MRDDYLYTHDLGTPPTDDPISLAEWDQPTVPMEPVLAPVRRTDRVASRWLKFLGWIAMFFLLAEAQPGGQPPLWLVLTTWAIFLAGMGAFIIDSVRWHPDEWRTFLRGIGILALALFILHLFRAHERRFAQEIARAIQTPQP